MHDPRVQRLAHRGVVRRVPGALHPARGSRASCSAPTGWPSEIRRVAEKGCHAVSFHSEAHRFGMPDHHGDEWDPAWQACEDTGTVDGVPLRRRARTSCRARRSTVIPHSMPFQTGDLRVGAAVVADAAQVPDREDRARRGRHRLGPVLPREGRLRLRPPPARGPAPTSATSSRARCSASTCRRASSTTTPGCATAH